MSLVHIWMLLFKFKSMALQFIKAPANNLIIGFKSRLSYKIIYSANLYASHSLATHRLFSILSPHYRHITSVYLPAALAGGSVCICCAALQPIACLGIAGMCYTVFCCSALYPTASVKMRFRC